MYFVLGFYLAGSYSVAKNFGWLSSPRAALTYGLWAPVTVPLVLSYLTVTSLIDRHNS